MTDNNMLMQDKKNKRPSWTRILDIILRTAHVAVIGILFGGAVFDVSFHRLGLWFYLSIASGLALVASEVYHNRYWLHQGRGIMVLIHAVLFVLIRLRPDLIVLLLTAAVVFGMVGSHMPKRFRYWSVISRNVMD